VRRDITDGCRSNRCGVMMIVPSWDGIPNRARCGPNRLSRCRDLLREDRLHERCVNRGDLAIDGTPSGHDLPSTGSRAAIRATSAFLGEDASPGI
jgi:hypothetical protein